SHRHVEPAEVLARHRDDVAANDAAAIGTIARVDPSDDPQPQQQVLHILGQLARDRVVRRLAAADRDVTITIPETRKEKPEICVTELEDFSRHELRVRATTPEPELAEPRDGTAEPRPVVAPDANGEAIATEFEDRVGVREAFDRAHELVAMCAIGRV